MTSNSLLKSILLKKKDKYQKARNLKLNLEQTERINFFINKRYDNFQNNTSRMLDSILKRKKEKVDFQKIITAEEIITEPRDIKEYTSKHFANWTRYNPPNSNLQHIQERYYKPIESLSSSIYSNLIAEITINELQDVIKISPHNKALRLLQISNEIL